MRPASTKHRVTSCNVVSPYTRCRSNLHTDEMGVVRLAQHVPSYYHQACSQVVESEHATHRNVENICAHKKSQTVYVQVPLNQSAMMV